MAVTSKPPNNNHHHNHNNNLLTTIPIDMSTLSHSELHLLSLLSSPPTTTPTTTTTTTQFSINPSLSTHQQTYSLSPHHPRRHLLLLTPPQLSESHLIVSFLRHHHHHPIDTAALENSDTHGGPFAAELKNRSNGRIKEEELLEMLGSINGVWCSKRKKRRIIDASLLGDALPLGWKVIVALRRKGPHFFPFCRRYISPSGEQFLSCKEVSSYLKSCFGISDAQVVKAVRAESQQLQTIDSVDNMCTILEDDHTMLKLPNSTMPNTCVSIVQQEASILGLDDLADVPVHDLYECYSCNLSFNEKDKYLQHVLLLHQKTTRRYTLDSSMEDKVIITDGEPQSKKGKKRRKRSSVGDGVIMKDGKYGCQFCDKVFEERRRYLGHVGNHVKGSIKSYKVSHVDVIESAKSPCLDRSPSTNISKMDALIEIAQSSIQDFNIPVTRKEPASVNKIDQRIMAENLQHMDVDLETENVSSSHLNGADDGNGLRVDNKTLSAELHHSKEVQMPVYSSSDKVTELSVTDKEVNYTDGSRGECQGEDTIRENSFSLQLNAEGKMGKHLRIDGNNNDPFSCSSEQELEKFVGEDETLPRNLNPLAMMSKRSAFDGEINGHLDTCSRVNFEDPNSEAIMIPIENGVSENISSRCKSSTADGEESSDELLGAFSTHHLQCNGIASDFPSDNIPGENVHNQGPESALKFDGNELVPVFNKSNPSGSPVPQISLNSSSPFDEIFEKAGQNICSLDQNLESDTGLEYMKLDVIEPQMYKYSGMSRDNSISFYEVSMNMGNDLGLGLELDNSLKSQPGFPQERTVKCLTTTVCVWCGVEFSHEIGDVELQPDSVGFMCPVCRAKISKQFNDLESNFPEFSIL